MNNEYIYTVNYRLDTCSFSAHVTKFDYRIASYRIIILMTTDIIFRCPHTAQLQYCQSSQFIFHHRLLHLISETVVAGASSLDARSLIAGTINLVIHRLSEYYGWDTGKSSAYLGAAGQSDQEIEHEQTRDESLTVVLDDWIFIAERGDDCFRASELHSHQSSILTVNPLHLLHSRQNGVVG